MRGRGDLNFPHRGIWCSLDRWPWSLSSLFPGGMSFGKCGKGAGFSDCIFVFLEGSVLLLGVRLLWRCSKSKSKIYFQIIFPSWGPGFTWLRA